MKKRKFCNQEIEALLICVIPQAPIAPKVRAIWYGSGHKATITDPLAVMQRMSSKCNCVSPVEMWKTSDEELGLDGHVVLLIPGIGSKTISLAKTVCLGCAQLWFYEFKCKRSNLPYEFPNLILLHNLICLPRSFCTNGFIPTVTTVDFDLMLFSKNITITWKRFRTFISICKCPRLSLRASNFR